MLEVLPTFLKSVSKEESKCILYLMLSLLFSLVAQIMILGGKMAKMATPWTFFIFTFYNNYIVSHKHVNI